MVELRSSHVGIFGRLVPAPNSHCVARKLQAGEGVGLRGGHRAALHLQRPQRRRRQRLQVTGLRRAQVPLGRDVQADRFGDRYRQPLSEPVRARFLVALLTPVVDGAQVPDIV